MGRFALLRSSLSSGLVTLNSIDLMMTSNASLAALVLSLAGPALAQAPVPSPVTVPVKDGGTYHLSTGTWSRGLGTLALAGPEVLYNNTCTNSLWSALPGGEVQLDSGRIPSTSSPNSPTSLQGLYDQYEVNAFQLSYCSLAAGPVDFDISFYDCYTACEGTAGIIPQPLVTFNMVNAPGGAGAGSLGCWLITLDLTNSPGVFQLGGDCNGTYDDVLNLDQFAWSWTTVSASTSGDTGPMIAGDPLGLLGTGCGGIGDGTTFVGAGQADGTGIGALDQFELSGGMITPGCYFYGGYDAQTPYASFYLSVQGDGAPAASAGTGFCFGDGTGAACSCLGNGGAGEGCANTTGSGAVLTGSGSASFANDTFQLTVTGAPGNKPGLLLRGSNQSAIPAGDGILCTTGASRRSQMQVTSGGMTTYTDFAGAPFGAVANVGTGTYFQFWYRDPGNTCTGSGFNFTGGWAVTYRP